MALGMLHLAVSFMHNSLATQTAIDRKLSEYFGGSRETISNGEAAWLAAFAARPPIGISCLMHQLLPISSNDELFTLNLNFRRNTHVSTSP